MTWFGPVSAWGAAAMGVLFGVNAYFQFATGVSGWIYTATALALLIGAFRTLRKMSGGLRLLAAAWGIAAGLWMLPFVTAPPSVDGSLHGAYYIAASPLAMGLLLAALAGVALTVLHKESK